MTLIHGGVRSDLFLLRTTHCGTAGEAVHHNVCSRGYEGTPACGNAQTCSEPSRGTFVRVGEPLATCLIQNMYGRRHGMYKAISFTTGGVLLVIALFVKRFRLTVPGGLRWFVRPPFSPSTAPRENTRLDASLSHPRQSDVQLAGSGHDLRDHLQVWERPRDTKRSSTRVCFHVSRLSLIHI